MFLYYREENKLTCDTLTKFLTTVELCVWKNFDYNIIVCTLLFLLLITVLKYSK